MVADDSVTGLGLDFYVPSLTSSNLLVFVGHRSTGVGAATALIRVAGSVATLSGSTGVNTSSRYSLQQFRNPTQGWKRITAEPSGASTIENAFLVAALFKNGGEVTSPQGAFTNPLTTSSAIASTDTLALFYWAYGATAISGDGTLKSVMEVPEIGHSLGAFGLYTGTGSGSTLSVGIDVTGETERAVAYADIPYSAT
jgi:hypothetical protein